MIEVENEQYGEKVKKKEKILNIYIFYLVIGYEWNKSGILAVANILIWE